MSAGNKIIQLRVDGEMLEKIENAIESANKHESIRGYPYDMPAWIRMCINSRLDYLKRSKRKMSTINFRIIVVMRDGTAEFYTGKYYNLVSALNDILVNMPGRELTEVVEIQVMNVDFDTNTPVRIIR